MMKYKLLLLIGLLSALIVIAGCGVQPGKSMGKSSFAGQAVSGYSDKGCVEGLYLYEVNGQIVGSDTGCTTMNDQGQMNTENPWCPTQTIEKDGNQVYVSGGRWQYCEREVERKAESSQPERETVAKETGYGGKGICSDSDKGKDFLTKGTVEVQGETYEDTCHTFSDGSIYLFEAICGDTKFGNDPFYYVQKKCEEGSGEQGMEKGAYQCTEGKCVQKLMKEKCAILAEIGPNNKAKYELEKPSTWIAIVSSFTKGNNLESWNTNEGVFHYNQFLVYSDEAKTSGVVKSGVNGEAFFIQKGHPVGKYIIQFAKSATSDVTDLEGSANIKGTILHDFKNTELHLFKEKYTVVQATRPATNPTNSIKFVLTNGIQEITLRDDDITDNKGSYDLVIGSEAIDGTTVIITGTDNNKIFSIKTIEVNMVAQSDYTVPLCGKLSDAIGQAGDEKEMLMGGLFEIVFIGKSGNNAEIYLTYPKKS